MQASKNKITFGTLNFSYGQQPIGRMRFLKAEEYKNNKKNNYESNPPQFQLLKCLQIGLDRALKKILTQI